jgi:hypothetical protein
VAFFWRSLQSIIFGMLLMSVYQIAVGTNIDWSSFRHDLVFSRRRRESARISSKSIPQQISSQNFTPLLTSQSFLPACSLFNLPRRGYVQVACAVFALLY